MWCLEELLLEWWNEGYLAVGTELSCGVKPLQVVLPFYCILCLVLLALLQWKTAPFPCRNARPGHFKCW